MNRKMPADETDTKKSMFSIVIPCYKGELYIEKCLDSIYSCSMYPDFEIILVDDASPEPIPDTIKSKYPLVRFYRNPRNSGFVHTVNHGASLAKGDIIIFLNVDTQIITPGWLYILRDVMETEKNIGAVGAKILYPDTNLTQFAGAIVGSGADHMERLYFMAPPFIPQLNKRREVDMIDGSFLVINRQVFREHNGFSTDFHSCHEDADLCFRLKQNGYRNLFIPEVVLYHDQEVTGLTSTHAFESSLMLSKKWDGIMTNDHISIYQSDGFSPLFIEVMLRIFRKNFYWVYLVMEEFRLHSPQEQEQFISNKSDALSLLSFLIHHYASKNTSFLPDLNYYSLKFSLDLEASHETCISIARDVLHFGFNSIHKDETRIILTLLGDTSLFNVTHFSNPKYYDMYKLLSRMKKGPAKPSHSFPMYEKGLFITLLRLITATFYTMPPVKAKPFIDFILAHPNAFEHKEDFIYFLLKLAYTNYEGEGIRFVTQAQEIASHFQWPVNKGSRIQLKLFSYYETTRNYDAAVEGFQKILEKGETLDKNTRAGTFYHLGICYTGLNDVEKAKESFETCLEIMPEHIMARRRLREIES